MTKVFISYKRLESSMLANLLKDRLLQLGIDAFVDTQNIEDIGPFPEKLRKEIENSDVIIVLLGDTTLQSKWILEEINQGFHLRKPFIPVFQEEYKEPGPIPDKYREAVQALLMYAGVNIFDKRNEYVNEAIEKIVKMISSTKLNETPPNRNQSNLGHLYWFASDLTVAAPVAIRGTPTDVKHYVRQCFWHATKLSLGEHIEGRFRRLCEKTASMTDADWDNERRTEIGNELSALLHAVAFIFEGDKFQSNPPDDWFKC